MKTTNGLFYSKRKLETKHYNYFIFWSPHTNESNVGEKMPSMNLVTGLRILHTEFFDGDNFEIKSINNHYKKLNYGSKIK
jgi:UDP-2,3-diacylglucosamine hydrolase